MFFQNIFLFCFFTRLRSERCNFYIISYSAEFVKCFFWNFLLKYFVHTFLFTLGSFSLSFRSVWISFSLFQDSLSIISYFVCFVKRFFKKLLVFFLGFFGILWKPSGSLNPFSLSFTRLFLRFFALSVSQLIYYTTFFAVCQQFLLSFLLFVWLHRRCAFVFSFWQRFAQLSGDFFRPFAIITLLFLFIRLFCSSFCLYFYMLLDLLSHYSILYLTNPKAVSHAIFWTTDIGHFATYRRLSAVDRYIIAVRRCYRSIRRMQDRCSLVLSFAV